MKENEDIDVLISKFLSGEASPEEAIFLEDWKNSRKENLQYFNQSVKALGFETEFTEIEITDTDLAWKKITETEKVKSIFPDRNQNRSFRIAAGILLIIGLGSVLLFFLNKGSEVKEFHYTAEASQKNVRLEDGTEVVISPNSSISADAEYGKGRRLLHLKGSAYFSVVHDELHPFIIDAGNVFVKDIGTKFSIRNSPDSDTVYVHVDEGVVLVFDSAGSQITITANGNALYVKSTKQIIASGIEKTKSLEFSGTRLSEVVATLSEKFQKKIKIENSAAANCPITTAFKDEKIETILAVICETTGLSFEKTPEGYLIKGEKCNK